MTRHRRWDVRVSPEVDDAVVLTARRHGTAKLLADFRSGMDLLCEGGTRARGVKKLKGLDIWEMRIGDYRAFFCPLRGSNVFAVGALELKKTKRLRMDRLHVIQRRVHRWRDELEETI